jgi:hypothetical protein
MEHWDEAMGKQNYAIDAWSFVVKDTRKVILCVRRYRMEYYIYASFNKNHANIYRKNQIKEWGTSHHRASGRQ